MPVTRAVLYARVSTQAQAQEGVSLETQLEMAQRHCAAKDWVFRGQYVDVMSGRDGKRPELQHLMDDAAKKAFDVVIVYKLDRLARSTRKIYEVLGGFQDREIGFVSLTQDIDTTTTMGKAMTGFLAIVAEMESDHTGERVKSSMRHIISHGKRFGGQRALGYVDVEGRYVVHPEEAPIVREAFNAFLRIRTIRGTVEHLNSHGYRNRFGKPFSVQGMRVVLRNPVYLGNTVWSRSEVTKGASGKRIRRTDPSKWITCEATHEPIIEQSEWDDVQALLLERKGLHPRTIYGQQHYAWSSLIRCGGCGSGMNRFMRKGYICSNYVSNGKSSCPDHGYASDIFLDLAAIPKLADELRSVSSEAAISPAKMRAQAEKGKASINRKIAELESKKEREKQMFRGGFIEYEEMAENIKKIDGQILSLGERQEQGPVLPPKLPVDLVDAWGRLGEQGRGMLIRSIVDHCESSKTDFIFHLKPFDYPGWPDTISLPRRNMQRNPEG